MERTKHVLYQKKRDDSDAPWTRSEMPSENEDFYKDFSEDKTLFGSGNTEIHQQTNENDDLENIYKNGVTYKKNGANNGKVNEVAKWVSREFPKEK